MHNNDSLRYLGREWKFRKLRLKNFPIVETVSFLRGGTGGPCSASPHASSRSRSLITVAACLTCPMPRGRPKGAKNRKTSARERAEKIAIARAELAKHAPPIDFSAVLDSLTSWNGSCAVSTCAA